MGRPESATWPTFSRSVSARCAVGRTTTTVPRVGNAYVFTLKQAQALADDLAADEDEDEEDPDLDGDPDGEDEDLDGDPDRRMTAATARRIGRLFE